MDNQDKQTEATVSIQRIYLKDASLETHNTPQIFREDWTPAVSIDLDAQNRPLEEDFYEVELTITVKGQKDSKDVLVIEVQLAGIFNFVGFDEKGMEHLLNVYAPGALFPYAREVIADLSTRASFPPLHLAPVNFQALYEFRKQEAEKRSQSGDTHETAQ
jgi:preprotein translocase subunit SecB